MFKSLNKHIPELINSDFKQDVTFKTMDIKKRQELEDYKNIWLKSADLKSSYKIDVEEDWQLVKQRINFHPKTKKIDAGKFFLRIAAIFILAIGLGFGLRQIVIYYQINSSSYITQSTTSDIKEVILPDGSVISLNKNSSFSYNHNFNNTNRDIILVGEAHFNVAKNDNNPFKVYTGFSTVEVVGTVFNIKQTDSVVKVDVTEGLVKLYESENNTNGVELTKNEGAVFNEEDKSINKVIIDLTALQWLPDKMNFVSQPINEVLASIAERHNLNFEPLEEFDSINYTGNLSNKQLNEIITLINLSLSNKEKQLVQKENELILSTLN